MRHRTLVIIGLAAVLAFTTHASQEQLARSIRDTQVETIRTDSSEAK